MKRPARVRHTAFGQLLSFLALVTGCAMLAAAQLSPASLPLRDRHDQPRGGPEPPWEHVLPVPVQARSSAPLAPPLEALPVTRLQGVAAPIIAGLEHVPVAPAITVAIVPESESALDAAVALAMPLRDAGVSVELTSFPLGDVADVLLILALSDWPAAWYCDPGPALARVLASQLASQPGLASTGGPPAHLVPPEMPCDYAAGATLVTLVSLTPTAGSEVAMALGGTVRQFLARNAVALREAKERTRLIWPARGPVTSHFNDEHPLGIDIAQASGAVVAATEGVVRWAGGDRCCSYGLYVIIDGPGGISTLYGHLASLAVRTGERVFRGQRLGDVGCTGRCSGPHLHFEVMQNGRRIDPLLLLP